MSAWNCLHKDCPAGATDLPWAAADREAAAHTRATQHGTNTVTVGSVRVRDEGGRVRNVRGVGT